MVNERVLDDETKRTKGFDALNSNIEAAKAISNILKSTLGPMGLDKMLIDSFGETTITNDGAKILKEMNVEHPGAKMLVEIAKTQEAEVGDGTTTAVLLAGELLSRAQNLLEKGIHPINIIKAYKLGLKESLDLLNKNSLKIDVKDKRLIKKIIETSITGKETELSKETISNLIYNLAKQIEFDDNFDRKKITIIKSIGGNTDESSLFNGVIINKDLAYPLEFENKKEKLNVLLINFPLEVRELDSEVRINLNSVEEYKKFMENEKNYLFELANKIKSLGVNFVFCQKGIDDEVAYYLAKNGIYSVRRTKKSDLEKLSLLLGKKIVSTEDDLIKENVGLADFIDMKKFNNDNYILVKGNSKNKILSILLRGSTLQSLNETERALDDALGDLFSLLKSKKIVGGGGAIELEIYKKLLEFSKKFSSKTRIILEEFAESFLVIPKTLCENSGLDVIDNLSKLKSLHEKGERFAGFNGLKGVSNNVKEEGILEPINIKLQAIKSAVEINSTILRIDDIIVAKKIESNNLNLDEN